MNKRNILILTGSYWDWHNAAANWLKTYIESNHNDNVFIRDFLDFIWKTRWKFSKNVWIKIVEQFPVLRWKTFDFFDTKRLNELIWKMNPLLQRKFNKKVDEFKPDHIIIVIPFWIWFVTNHNIFNKKSYSIDVVITDAMNIHSSWYNPVIDRFFVIDDNTKLHLEEKFHHKLNNSYVSFFPLPESIFVNKNIIPKTVLILLTWISDEYAISFINNIWFDYKLIIVRWRNNRLFELLKSKFSEFKNVEFYEYIVIKEQLANVWFYIWKPGWAITSELIATDTFAIIPCFVPWLEDWNLKLLQSLQVWVYLPNPISAVFCVKNTQWQELLPNFQKVKKKDSVKFIINKIYNEK